MPGPVCFDIGANDGSTSIPWAEQGATVFAFEPIPQLAERIRAATAHLPNYRVIEKAVSNAPGMRKFHVMAWEDWGCSSLLERTPYAFVTHRATWPNRADFPVTDVIEVEAIRLEDFVRDERIERVDFVHVDTQGEDVNVLKSFGPSIAIVQSGLIEIATCAERKLYEGQSDFFEAAEVLKEMGFYIAAAQPNGNDHELNVYFKRR